jgi:hypothetical protein
MDIVRLAVDNTYLNKTCVDNTYTANPANLIDALQDSIHVELNIARKAKSYKVKFKVKAHD